MKNYRFIGYIYFASGISISILILFGIVYLVRSRDQVQYYDAVEHTYKVLSTINYCEKILLEAESAQRGYLLTGELGHLDLFTSTLPLLDSSLIALGGLSSENIGQRTYFLQLKKFVVARVGVLKENLSLQGKHALHLENLRKGAYLMDNSRIYMAKMRTGEETILHEQLKLKNNYQRLNLSWFKATFITACLISIIAIGFFFRELGIRLTAQQNLKDKIVELSNSNQELEEITYAASHDLQEPMRKVSVLSTLINKKLIKKVPEADLEEVHRISKITEKMQGMLNDLVLYTNLLNPNEKFGDANLYDIFLIAYNKVFMNENVQFRISPQLPVIHGSQSQLEAMLVHLLDNALKFKAPDRQLTITVKYELRKVKEAFWNHFSSRQLQHQVTITDNGIGFEKQYNSRIFGLFQRLHTQTEIPGKGIGLSIARRVMLNHKGFISSMGEKSVGASFILVFPVMP